jgi:heme-degrading monooxygenase HmoA
MTEREQRHVAPPCFAVLFVSRRTLTDDGYADALARMEELVATQPGYLGVRSVRDADRRGITLVFFASGEEAAAWGRNQEHRAIMRRGRDEWYEDYEIYYAQVERAHSYQHALDANRRSPPNGEY